MGLWDSGVRWGGQLTVRDSRANQQWGLLEEGGKVEYGLLRQGAGRTAVPTVVGNELLPEEPRAQVPEYSCEEVDYISVCLK